MRVATMTPTDGTSSQQPRAAVVPISREARRKQQQLDEVLARRDRLSEIAAERFAHGLDGLAEVTRDQMELEELIQERFPHVYITKLYEWVVDDSAMLHYPPHKHPQCSVCRGTTGPWIRGPLRPDAA